MKKILFLVFAASFSLAASAQTTTPAAPQQGQHKGQVKTHTNKGKHKGQMKTHSNKGKHKGQYKNGMMDSTSRH